MSRLVSQALIPMRHPAHMVSVLCRHFAEEEVDASWADGRGDVRFAFGYGVLEAGPERLAVTAEAGDLASLMRVKNILASHLEELAPDERLEIVWTGDGCDATELPNLRVMRVERSLAPTPLMRRITLAGDDLGRFAAGGHHVKVLIPPEGISIPEWPTPGRNGRPRWPAPDRCPAMRTYTIRRLDVAAGEMDIDFVLHGDEGIASRWAAGAKEGDVVGIMGPGGAGVREADWYLLAGDMTALPAIARIMESLPTTARGIALIEVPGAAEEQALPSAADITLRYLHADHAPADGPGQLEQAVRAVALPDGLSPFVFVGAEAKVARRLRAYCRQERGLDRKRHLCAAYWRRGQREGEGPADEAD